KLRHPARNDVGRAPSRALYVFAAPARRALKAGRMMVHENAVAGFEAAHRRAGLLDDADRFVAEHERRLALEVPGHDVARANAARARADQNVAVADLGPGAFLDADVVEIVEPCYLHRVTAVLESHHATAEMSSDSRRHNHGDRRQSRFDRAQEFSTRVGNSRRIRRFWRDRRGCGESRGTRGDLARS